MEEFVYELKIPKERIAILIGRKGEIKKEIEQSTNTKIEVDSKEGDIFIIGKNGLDIFCAKQIIRAIGRGFNPEIALLLLKPDYSFEMLDIGSYAKTKNSIIRLKGRVIGKSGKSRRTIERLTECYISVYGKTIGIIGRVEQAQNARKAIDSLLKGSQHANAFRWLESKRRQLRLRELEEKQA